MNYQNLLKFSNHYKGTEAGSLTEAAFIVFIHPHSPNENLPMVSYILQTETIHWLPKGTDQFQNAIKQQSCPVHRLSTA